MAPLEAQYAAMNTESAVTECPTEYRLIFVLGMFDSKLPDDLRFLDPQFPILLPYPLPSHLEVRMI